MTILIWLLIIMFLLGVYNDLPNKKWYRKLRGGKWWLCTHYSVGDFWINSVNKPEGLDIIEYEDYDKKIN